MLCFPAQICWIILVIWFTTRACDWNLEKEEVLKLASLGNKASNKDEVSTLVKTLDFRNK